MKIFIIIGGILVTIVASSCLQTFVDKPLVVRITGGQFAKPKQFPYHVGLSIQSSNIGRCGGSLVTARWVLTAAHCVANALRVKVFLGANNLSHPNQTMQITTSLSNVFLHPYWNSTKKTNDIALLKLPNDAILNDYVQLIKLPEVNNDTYVGDDVLIAGWGLTSDDSSSTDSDLRYIKRKVVDNSVCRNYYQGNAIGKRNICMSTTGTLPNESPQSPCRGDSGGPLVLSDAEWTQIGVLSYGKSSGCEKGSPIVMTRVASFLYWINNVISDY